MKPQPDIVVAGELFVDLILSGCAGWPAPGKEVFASQFRREIGGGTAITACGLAKLGLDVALLGVVGNEWGEWMLDELSRRNVNVQWVDVDADEPTAFTVIATMPHDRAFLTYCGANRGLEPLLEKMASVEALSAARHIHLAYAPPLDRAERLFRLLRANGCTVSIDFGWREHWVADQRSLELLRHVDIFFPNELEAQHLTNEVEPREILNIFRSAHVRRVVLKLGARGAALLWDGDIFFVGPHAVTAIDTTGAGDCFDAGFLYGWLCCETPQTCLRMANVCGALSTTDYGGIAGFPNRERLLEETNKTELCAN